MSYFQLYPLSFQKIKNLQILLHKIMSFQDLDSFQVKEKSIPLLTLENNREREKSKRYQFAYCLVNGKGQKNINYLNCYSLHVSKTSTTQRFGLKTKTAATKMDQKVILNLRSTINVLLDRQQRYNYQEENARSGILCTTGHSCSNWSRNRQDLLRYSWEHGNYDKKGKLYYRSLKI